MGYGPWNGAVLDIQLLEITASRQGCQDARLQVLQVIGNKALDLDIQLAYLLAVAHGTGILAKEVDVGTVPCRIVTRITSSTVCTSSPTLHAPAGLGSTACFQLGPFSAFPRHRHLGTGGYGCKDRWGLEGSGPVALRQS